MYLAAKDIKPTHAYVSPYTKSRLLEELPNATTYNDDLIVTTMIGGLVVVTVQEEKNDFLLVGLQDDYLNYVIERTVLK